MRTENRALAIAIALGFSFWIIDAAVDSLFFYDESFLESLLFDVVGVELYMRSLVLVLFLAVGVIMSRMLAKQRRVQETLRASENRYMTLVEQASDAIAVTDVEGNLLDVNNRAVELFGYPKDELLNKHLSGLHPQEEHERVSEAFGNAIKQGSGALNDTAIIRKDGTAVAVDITGSVIEIEGARFVQAFFRDITERKRAEESLRQSESALRELSAQLLNAQEDERARLTADLHDGVGQTLGSIKVRLEAIIKKAMLNEGKVDAESLKDLISVTKTAMEEVRNISMDLRPSTLDSLGLIVTINWLCREFKITHDDIGVEVRTEIQEDEIPESLKVQIFRILQEALNNVAKHSEADSVQVYLGLKDGFIKLAIEDNGSGVDLKGALPLEDGKRGFGIPSMKQRTEYYGGSFSFEAREGKGTSVKASWPVTAWLT